MKLDKKISEPTPAPIDGARWIPLGSGRFVLVDEVDFGWLSKKSWTLDGSGHVARDTHGMIRSESLHRLVLGITDPGVHIDHKNRDKLDCRKNNLRIATRQGNGANRGKFTSRVFTSRYKGVTRRGGRNPFVSRIRVDGMLKYLGRYAIEVEAAVAYDAAALYHFGEFACTNFDWPSVA